MPDVYINDQLVDGVVEISQESQTNKLGGTTIGVLDISANRQFSSGDDVRIERTNGETWTGNITGQPTSESSTTIEIKAMDSRYELQQRNVNRPFYRMNDGEIVSEAVQYKSEGRGNVVISTCDLLDSWESDFDEFELGQFASKRLHERGSDVIFGGLRSGASGTYYIRYTDVPAQAVIGSHNIYNLTTRFNVNDEADQITLEIELVSNEGTSMMWTVTPDARGFETHELGLEDAEEGQGNSAGTLEYRINISGSLANNTGVAIDFAEAFPFVLKERQSDLTTEHVQLTDRRISRRFDGSILEMNKDLEDEVSYDSWVDEHDDVHFEPAGGNESALQIIRGETAVTEADFDRDYDRVVNEVLVQGDGVQQNVRDSESIKYYGISSREEPIVDTNIKTVQEAEDRGNGFLNKNAWADTVATFTIADTRYQRVSSGDSIIVNWPPVDLVGSYVVKSKSVTSEGFVSLEVGVRT